MLFLSITMTVILVVAALVVIAVLAYQEDIAGRHPITARLRSVMRTRVDALPTISESEDLHLRR